VKSCWLSGGERRYNRIAGFLRAIQRGNELVSTKLQTERLASTGTGVPPQSRRKGKGAAGLYGIIAIKLAKSLLLFGIAVGIYSLMDKDLSLQFERFLRWVRVDPEHQFFADLGDWLQTITPASIRWFASGTLIYGCLLFVESVGLMLRASWAMWLAIGETAFFIPIEVYHLARDFSLAVTLILAVNSGIVWYLVKNRKRLFHPPVPAKTPSPAPSPAPSESQPFS